MLRPTTSEETPNPMRPPLALLLLPLLTSPLHAQPSQPAPDFSELEHTALDEMTSTGTPGMAVAVIRGNRVVFAHGLGVANVETSVPVTPDTLFRVGSVTKMLTAIRSSASSLSISSSAELRTSLSR